MTIPIVPSGILVLGAAAALAGCGTVRLQSFERMSKEATQATYRADRKDCARHTDSAAYRDCVQRTDQVYEELKTSREKAAEAR